KREFRKTKSKKAIEGFQKEVDALPGLNTQIEDFDQTIGMIKGFEKSSFAGTGPLAQYGSSNPMVNPDAELLDRRFKKLQFKDMRIQFAGMSKAIDSDAERKFYAASQGNIGNRPETNIMLMLGGKSIAMKKQAETEAKMEWVEKHGSLEKYKSPVIGKVTTVVDKNGKMHLLDKKELTEAKKRGLMTIDQYSKVAIKDEGSGLIDEAYATNPEDVHIKVKAMSLEEKIRILEGR
ncbi:unnamed protein product, partial [marine sediment metagenome]